MVDAQTDPSTLPPKQGMDKGLAWTWTIIGGFLTIALIAVAITDERLRAFLAVGPLVTMWGVENVLGIVDTRRGRWLMWGAALATLARSGVEPALAGGVT